MSSSRSSRGRGVSRGRAVQRGKAVQHTPQPMAFYTPDPPATASAPKFGMFMANNYEVLNTGTSSFGHQESEYNSQLFAHEVAAEYAKTYGHTEMEDEPETQYEEEEAPDVQEVPGGFVTPQASKKQRFKAPTVKMEGDGKRWEKFEDVLLVSVWCNTTETVWEQKGDTYWKKITSVYNSEIHNQGGPQRSLKALQNRWSKFISPPCTIWYAADKATRALVKSGQNEMQMLERTKVMYNRKHPLGESFKFLHVVHLLLSCEKFVATCTRNRIPTFDTTNVDPSTPPTTGSSQNSTKRSIESSNATDEITSPSKEPTNDEGQRSRETKRPSGVKALKAKKQMLFNESPAGQERQRQRDNVRAAEYDLEKLRIESLVAATRERNEAIKEKASASARKATAKFRAEQRLLLKQMKDDATTPEAKHMAQMYAEHFYKKCMDEDEFHYKP